MRVKYLIAFSRKTEIGWFGLFPYVDSSIIEYIHMKSLQLPVCEKSCCWLVRYIPSVWRLWFPIMRLRSTWPLMPSMLPFDVYCHII